MKEFYYLCGNFKIIYAKEKNWQDCPDHWAGY